MYKFPLPATERSVHSDVRGALGGRRRLRLQDPGSDAGVSQLSDVYGLMAGRDVSEYTHPSASIKTLKKRRQSKQNKSSCKLAWSPYCSVKKENCKA